MSEEKKTTTEVQKYKNITDDVLAKVKNLREVNLLRVPKEYAPENALKAAWIVLQDVKTREGKRALDVCSKESIALALFKMVTEGLNPIRKHGSFIAYGNALQWQTEYDGEVLQAKRAGLEWIRSRTIYEGDKYVTEVLPDGRKILKSHEQPIDNVDENKIKGAYAVYKMQDSDEIHLVELTKKQILSSWGQGATKGQSPAHKNFPSAMSERTVTRKAVKPIIRRANDSYLEDPNAEFVESTIDAEAEVIESLPEANTQEMTMEEAPKEEPKEQPKKPEPKQEAPEKPKAEGSQKSFDEF